MALGAILGAALAVQSAAVPSLPARTPLALRDPATAVAEMVDAIASYARWPVQPLRPRICVTGATRIGDSWIARDADGVRVRRVPPGGAPFDDCHIAYIGTLAGVENARLYAALRGRAILTIAENDPPCRNGAMVCLDIRADSLAFSLNIDAVSRSGVRIDPRVLRLARPTA